MLSTPHDGDEGVADDDGEASATHRDAGETDHAPVEGGGAADAETAVRPRSDGSGGDGRREVVVPMRLYKTVTVFSTLIAVVCVVLGFAVLDAATIQWSFLRRFVVGTLARLGVTVAPDALSAALALVGLGVIGFGAGVYVLGTRFRARGMGNSQEDSNEDTDNG